MGLFDAFKKKECCICGNEVGLLGNRKLADGNMCNKCAKKLSPWFEDRRESTVAQIKEQLAYRERNAQELQHFAVTRVIGEAYKMYVEEVNGVPTRFFVTDDNDYLGTNPDIISFRDVVSCVTDIDVRDEEMKCQNKEGKYVSYNPPRYKHHHTFYMEMQIRNNPYFDKIRFYVNRGVVTLESIGGFGNDLTSAFLRGAGVHNARFSTGSLRDAAEQKRYNEYQQMCQIISQTVEDGKRGAVAPGAPELEAILRKIDQINHAPDLPAAVTLGAEVAREISRLSDPDWERVKTLNDAAVAEAKQRFGYRESSTPPQEAPKPKFCPNCGAPNEGGKFCPSCGSKL